MGRRHEAGEAMDNRERLSTPLGFPAHATASHISVPLSEWESKRQLIATVLGTAEELLCHTHSRRRCSPPQSAKGDGGAQPESDTMQPKGTVAGAPKRTPTVHRTVSMYEAVLRREKVNIFLSKDSDCPVEWEAVLHRFAALPTTFFKGILANAYVHSAVRTDQDAPMSFLRPIDSFSSSSALLATAANQLETWSAEEAAGFTASVLGEPLCQKTLRQLLWTGLSRLHEGIIRQLTAVFADDQALAWLRGYGFSDVAELQSDLFELPGNVFFAARCARSKVPVVHILPNSLDTLFDFETRSDGLVSALGRPPTDVISLGPSHQQLRKPNSGRKIPIPPTDALWELLCQMSNLRRVLVSILQLEQTLRQARPLELSGAVQLPSWAAERTSDSAYRKAQLAYRIGCTVRGSMDQMCKRHRMLFLLKVKVRTKSYNSKVPTHPRILHPLGEAGLPTQYKTVQELFNSFDRIFKLTEGLLGEEGAWQATDTAADQAKLSSDTREASRSSPGMMTEDKQFLAAVVTQGEHLLKQSTFTTKTVSLSVLENLSVDPVAEGSQSGALRRSSIMWDLSCTRRDSTIFWPFDIVDTAAGPTMTISSDRRITKADARQYPWYRNWMKFNAIILSPRLVVSANGRAVVDRASVMEIIRGSLQVRLRIK